MRRSAEARAGRRFKSSLLRARPEHARGRTDPAALLHHRSLRPTGGRRKPSHAALREVLLHPAFDWPSLHRPALRVLALHLRALMAHLRVLPHDGSASTALAQHPLTLHFTMAFAYPGPAEAATTVRIAVLPEHSAQLALLRMLGAFAFHARPGAGTSGLTPPTLRPTGQRPLAARSLRPKAPDDAMFPALLLGAHARLRFSVPSRHLSLGIATEFSAALQEHPRTLAILTTDLNLDPALRFD